MDPTDAYLGQLEGWMRERTAAILDAAASVEEAGGENAAWRGVLTEYGVARTTAEERLRVLKSGEQKKGALPGEVQACLEWVAREVQKNLRRLGSPDGYDAKIDRLRAISERNTEEGLKTFRSRIFPKRGMFAHAREAAAKPQPWEKDGKPLAVPDVVVQACRFCGAPRTHSELKCHFCGEKFG